MSLSTRVRRSSMALIAAGLAATVTTVVTPVAQAASASDTYEGQIATSTKAERSKRSLPTISWQACLDGYAERQARAMAAAQRLYHSDVSAMLRDCKLSYAGENVAMGYPTGTAAVAGWMASAGHRANILDPHYRLYGHGAVQDSQGRWWAANTFGRAA